MTRNRKIAIGAGAAALAALAAFLLWPKKAKAAIQRGLDTVTTKPASQAPRTSSANVKALDAVSTLAELAAYCQAAHDAAMKEAEHGFAQEYLSAGAKADSGALPLSVLRAEVRDIDGRYAGR